MDGFRLVDGEENPARVVQGATQARAEWAAPAAPGHGSTPLMILQHVKSIVWLGTLAAGSTMAWSIQDFARHRAELATGVGREERLQVLNDVEAPPPPANRVVDYGLVTRVFHRMNWTGKPDPEVAAPGPGDEAPALAAARVVDLLDILMVQVDIGDSAGSLAVAAFTDPLLRAAVKEREDCILRLGTRLTDPHSDCRVTAITVEGVEFSFDDEERGKELIPPKAPPGKGPRIVVVGPDGAMRSRLGQRQAGPSGKSWCPSPPKENEYPLDPKTLVDMRDNYPSILSRDIATRVHRNPTTGRADGIEITMVRAGSLPASHGMVEGEVLKSINEHQVTSKSDAINYVKKEADHTDTWVAVFERRGRLITRTYHSPAGE